MNVKDLLNAKTLIGAAAVAAGGVGAVFVAPYLAGKATDTTNIKNWWAPGGVAVLIGGAIAALGKSGPALFAGVAMAGTGAGVLALSYTAKKATENAVAKTAITSGLMSPGTPVAPAALPRFIYNSGRGASYSSQGGFTPWSGVPAFSQRWAQRGGMPSRSGIMPQ